MPITRRDFLASSAFLAASSLAITGLARANRSIDPVLGQSALDEISAIAAAAVTAGNSPGIALAIWKNGKEIYSHYAGVANLETKSRVTAASVFRIGSLTKQFAGALILQLVSQKKLSLSDPAHKHLPFLAKHEPFTVQELLNHTAGVRDADYDVTRLKTHSQIEQAELIAQQDPFFDFCPGTAWLYSNANYILIGAIIEQASGKALADIANTLLFKPLGLQNTTFDNVADIVEQRASGYTPTDTPTRPFQNAEYLDVSRAGAAGAMRSTASDLCRWHQALFHGKFMPGTLTEKMITPGRLKNGRLASSNRFSENDKPMGETQYGLGLMLDNATRNASLIVNHHGGINGFASYLATHLESELSFACLCNVDTHPGLPFRELRRKIFQDILRPIVA